MKVYRIEFDIHATAYIKANSEKEAAEKAKGLIGDCLEVEENDDFSDQSYSDPDLPETSFSPAMTVGEPDLSCIEEVGDLSESEPAPAATPVSEIKPEIIGPEMGRNAALIERARELHGSDEIEIDDDADTSEGEDGTWVQAWVLVPKDEDEEEKEAAAA